VAPCQQLRSQIEKILNKAQLPLSKWASNHPDICPEGDSLSLSDFNLTETSHKTLGLYWQPNLNIFLFKARIDSRTEVSKRQFLSTISQIFDPFGLLSPILILHKMIM
jgi:Pao retrotransposon peptidase